MLMKYTRMIILCFDVFWAGAQNTLLSAYLFSGDKNVTNAVNSITRVRFKFGFKLPSNN